MTTQLVTNFQNLQHKIMESFKTQIQPLPSSDPPSILYEARQITIACFEEFEKQMQAQYFKTNNEGLAYLFIESQRTDFFSPKMFFGDVRRMLQTQT